MMNHAESKELLTHADQKLTRKSKELMIQADQNTHGKKFVANFEKEGVNMELLHAELTYKIRHCIFEVRKEIGSGFDEETYHQGLILSFELNALPFVSKERRALMHRGTIVRYFVNDFLLFDKIVLSVKCIPCKFLRAHYVQLFSELKLWGKDLGLIVNFGLPDLDIERYVFSEKEPVFVENYESIKDRTDETEQQIVEQILKAVKDVAIMHKLGYGKAIWRKIIETELNHLNFCTLISV